MLKWAGQCPSSFSTAVLLALHSCPCCMIRNAPKIFANSLQW